MFTINPDRQPNGFVIKFANGYELSVQWGAGNYCTNRYEEDRTKRVPAHTAEILLSRGSEIISNGLFLFETQDGTAGWQTPEDVARILYQISLLESDNA